MEKWYRSATDKKLTGLCGGLARRLDIDPTLLRLILVGMAVFSVGTVLFLYVAASLLVPEEPKREPVS